MINGNPSWDLFLLALVILLSAYGFLLGQNSTIKLIICIYVSILTADGLAGILKRFVIDVFPGFHTLMGSMEDSFLSILRIVLFLFSVVIFVIKSGFHINIGHHDHWGVRFLIQFAFSFLSAVLFLATMLIYFSGLSFFQGMIDINVASLYKNSIMANLLLEYYQFWFSLPAIAFLISSFLFEKK